MTKFKTKHLPSEPDDVAPDGSDVRILLDIQGKGSMAHFALAPGHTSVAVEHPEIDEIWYFLSGRGEMWRKDSDGNSETVDVYSGVCITIPANTAFQFRAHGDVPLVAIAITMPPWTEAKKPQVHFVDGIWEVTV